ncbi:hypothetical protein BX666DRAFT_2026551 [Dichotomocladium elegans]|nr:hypothetical protein BX666DRAFT_2026551 [Dichotomocladium elegans]
MPVFDALLSAQKSESSAFIYDRIPEYFTRNFSRLYELTQSNNNLTFNEISQVNPPKNIFPSGMVYDKISNSLFLFAAPSDPSNLSNTSLINANYLTVYRFELSTGEWTIALPQSGRITNTTTWPRERDHYAIAYDPENNQAYLGGGVNSDNKAYNDFWRIDFVDGNIGFSKLANLPSTRVSHEMAFLSDGRILFIGGSKQYGSNFISLSQIDVYDAHESQWVIVGPALRNDPALPNFLSSHTLAADSFRKRVIVTNGDTFINDTDYYAGTKCIPMIILDLTSWSWNFANTSGVPPERRSSAFTNIMDTNKLIMAFGKDGIDNFNDINVLELNTLQWIEGFSEEAEARSKARTKTIVISISSVVLGISFLCIAYFCWREKDFVKKKFGNLKDFFWDQRDGEPLWTEISRLSVMGATFACFVILLIFIVKQVLDSPTVVQSYTLPVLDLEIPDVRICIDDIVDVWDTFRLTCSFASGYSCADGIYPLNLSLFHPLAFHKNTSCYLFRAEENYTLSTDPLNPQGSKIEFSIEINEMGTNTTPAMPTGYLSLYPREKDPNVLVYNLPNTDEIIISDKEYDEWIIAEQHGDGSNNIYELKIGTQNNVQYSNGYRDNLNPTAWNLFGIFSTRTRSPLLETTFSYLPPEKDNMEEMPPGLFIATLRILPHKFEITVEKEVKVYTFLSAFGTVGGIAGILFSIQVLLFGQRPQSPWGFVQRFSFGRIRQSLLQSLRSKFPTTYVPLIDPLNSGSSDSTRLARMEQRMWVLERMLAAYHLNEDVFKGLNEAVTDEKLREDERKSASTRKT